MHFWLQNVYLIICIKHNGAPRNYQYTVQSTGAGVKIDIRRYGR